MGDIGEIKVSEVRETCEIPPGEEEEGLGLGSEEETTGTA